MRTATATKDPARGGGRTRAGEVAGHAVAGDGGHGPVPCPGAPRGADCGRHRGGVRR
jgi:hypothetical protein